MLSLWGLPMNYNLSHLSLKTEKYLHFSSIKPEIYCIFYKNNMAVDTEYTHLHTQTRMFTEVF